VTIGAKNFTESVVLGELLAQEIEAVDAQQGRRGEKVARRFYLAGSYLCHQALISGRIDSYVEYSGTALTAILKQPLPPPSQRDQVFATIQRLYQTRFHVTVEPGLGFDDTFAIVMRKADAQRLGATKISDLKGKASALRLGVGYEFQARPDGLAGLEKAYDLRFGQPRVMDLGLLYRALSSGQVDVVAGNSTDGPIRALGLTMLADDLHYFPPYEAVPLVADEALQRHPEIRIAMGRLAGKVSAAEMQSMNDAVDGRHEDVAEVVQRFRATKGL
jgi:osmoprotectant transport system substrate-binding protein